MLNIYTMRRGIKLMSDGEKALMDLCTSHGNNAANLLEILHDVQHENGFVAPDDIHIIADALNLSAAEVQGVISFYPDFKTTPPAKHTIKICRAEACQAQGSRGLEKNLSTALGVKMGEATADNHVAIEAVYCLGNCALGPAVMLDGKPQGRATVDGLLAQVRKG